MLSARLHAAAIAGAFAATWVGRVVAVADERCRRDGDARDDLCLASEGMTDVDVADSALLQHRLNREVGQADALSRIWALLDTAEGRALLAEAQEKEPKGIPPDWKGPMPALWGGPSIPTVQANYDIAKFPLKTVKKWMVWADWKDKIPRGLRGIFWMDQAGASSVAKDPKYPFYMPGATAEMLAGFGPDDAEFGLSYEPSTRCVTPESLWGPGHWAAQNNKAGEVNLGFHSMTRNTLSFCFTDSDMNKIQIYQKMLTSQCAIGPVVVGPVLGKLLGFLDAGAGFSWTPQNVFNMTMVKHTWGWDRVTNWYSGIQSNPLIEAILKVLLPPMTKAWHYPFIQVIDEAGKETKYWKEFVAFMRTVPGGAEQLLGMKLAGAPLAQ